MWNSIRYAQRPVWTNMTNAYPFLPITPKSMLIVLFDNNGLDLNLLDPFHFKFCCCALKAGCHACITPLFLTSLLPSAARSAWIKPRVMNRGFQGMAVLLFSEDVDLPKKKGFNQACWVFLTFWNQTRLLLTSKDMNNHKINDGQENLYELLLAVALVNVHPSSDT